MSAGEAVLLLVAGIGGGLTGSIAGLASVATYPALLLIGLPPVTANVTNTVALATAGFTAVPSWARTTSTLAPWDMRFSMLLACVSAEDLASFEM